MAMKFELRQLASPGATVTTSTVDALIKPEGIVSIVPQDMLVASFEESSMLPEIVSSGSSTTDYVTETLFSEAEKVPFSQEERQAITAALQSASERIQEQFQTNT
jgi:hypothetical protein